MWKLFFLPYRLKGKYTPCYFLASISTYVWKVIVPTLNNILQKKKSIKWQFYSFSRLNLQPSLLSTRIVISLFCLFQCAFNQYYFSYILFPKKKPSKAQALLWENLEMSQISCWNNCFSSTDRREGALGTPNTYSEGYEMKIRPKAGFRLNVPLHKLMNSACSKFIVTGISGIYKLQLVFLNFCCLIRRTSG